MFNISKIIESIAGKHNKVLLQRSLIAEIIKKETNMPAGEFSISFEAGVLSIKTKNQSAKNELYMKRENILAKIQAEIAGVTITDVKLN